MLAALIGTQKSSSIIDVSSHVTHSLLTYLKTKTHYQSIYICINMYTYMYLYVPLMLYVMYV